MTDPLELLDLVLAERRHKASCVVSLTLRHAQGLPLPPWEPGAHLDVLLGDGLERQYSLCGRDASSYRIAVLLRAAGRGGSTRVHAELHPGVRVRALGPRNDFPLESARPW